ncbi:hypothetical protein BCR33DRAFT_441965 [Rhizoclosmatium globosum]|uniref:HIT-type domain-containing protein n=1 Tax=Rhizoclosmatium globosum TaxID=329046 RepID=A0A1Y2BT80_9FUNG|nr:hypothetical protein BCR33DRAFT_441965 [Rhizoclosmatium globosum]|eukprot:ORY37960.1 hypothetical protein BCR33DRAFT_441965 [Rhizoclosmatium globosum]
MSSKTKPAICPICNLLPSKYKCPECYTPYCSVPCYKHHREQTCELGKHTDPKAKPNPNQHNSNTKPSSTQQLNPDESEQKLSDEQLKKLRT